MISEDRACEHGAHRRQMDAQAEIAGAPSKRRVVKIDLKALKNGDPRQNVVLRKNDIVYVPPVEMGEFYMGGRVARVGV